MKVALFAKKDKPTIDQVITHLKKEFSEVAVFVGVLGDAFPVHFKDYESDLLISYISPWIIPSEILAKTKKWNLNFHPGPPEYPGIGCFNFAIYDSAKEYGVTSHLMERKVDTGKIISVKRFPLLESYSVFDLSLKTYDVLFEIFLEVMDSVKRNQELPVCKESWKRNPYTRRDLEDLCSIEVYMKEKEIKRRIKATSYPNMPGAYIELFGYRFEYNSKR